MGQLTGSHKRGHRNPHMLQSPFDNEPLPSPPVPQRSPFLEHHYWRGTGFKTAAEVFEEQIESTREGGAPKSWNPGFETNDAFLLRLHAAETRDDKSERPHSTDYAYTLAVHTARLCYALPHSLPEKMHLLHSLVLGASLSHSAPLARILRACMPRSSHDPQDGVA